MRPDILPKMRGSRKPRLEDRYTGGMRGLSGLVALAALGGCIVHDHAPLPRPAAPPLAREELLSLVRAGIAGPVLFELADRRGVDPLDADTLATLKKEGASDGLLQKLILAERRAPPVVVVEAPPYDYGDYYGWAPYTPHFGWGFGFGWSSYRYYRPSRGIRIYR